MQGVRGAAVGRSPGAGGGACPVPDAPRRMGGWGVRACCGSPDADGRGGSDVTLWGEGTRAEAGKVARRLLQRASE